MRLAIVICSSYTESAVVTARDAFVDSAQLVEWRLAQADTGLRVSMLSANRDLPENLETLLAQNEGLLEDLLIYFAGYVAVKAERGPALLLDGTRLRAFPLSRLRAALSKAAAHVHVVMDVVAMAEAGTNVAAIAADIGRALHEMTPHVSVVTSAALPEHVDPARRGCARLTDLWLLALGYEALHAKDSLVFAGTVVHALQSERISFADLSSFDYQGSEQDFLLIPGLAVGGFSQGSDSMPINTSTERSLGVEPPGAETDPHLAGHGDASSHQPDTYVDELVHGSRGAPQESGSEEPVTPPPQGGVSGEQLGFRAPVLPPIPRLPTAAAAQANWVDRASYLPSVPPPVVLPRLPTPPVTAPHRDWSQLGPDSSGVAASPDNVEALELRVVEADRTGDARQRIERRIRLAMQLEHRPDQKARVLHEAGSISFHQLGDTETAFELSQESLRIDPDNAEAFDLCIETLARQDRLAEVVRRCSDVLTVSLKPDVRYQASRHLIMLLEAKGKSIDLDAEVIERLRDAVCDDPQLMDRVDSALRPHSEDEQALLYIQDTLEQNPRHVQSLRTLSDMAERANARDTAALASSVVVCLEEPRSRDVIRATRIAGDGLPQVTRILTDADLEENLLGAVSNVAQLRALSRVTKIAVAAGLAAEASNGKWSAPKGATILDPTASTTTLARSLAWAAHFVNVTTPLLVVVPDAQRPTELSVGEEARLLVSRQLGSGFSLAQLAFLGARQLCYLRSELLWRIVLGTEESATQVFGFCIRYAQHGPDFYKLVDDEQRKAAKRFSTGLQDDQSLARLVTADFAEFGSDAVVWRRQVEHWVGAVDRAALRIGLLACANPTAAWPLITRQPLNGSMSLDEQLDEIARFAISQGHQALRRSLGLITE